MKNDWKYRYHRKIRTKQERIANCEYVEDDNRVKLGRAKRSTWRLDPWNTDTIHNLQKSWKKRRKQQYYVGGRGKPTVFKCYDREELWNYKEYFERYDIPYKVEVKRQIITKVWYEFERDVFDGWVEQKCSKRDVFYTFPTFKTLYFDPPLRHTRRVCKKEWWHITYWTQNE